MYKRFWNSLDLVNLFECVLSVVQEIEKQALLRFDLVIVFSFLFQAKSETTQRELSFVFPATWSQEKVSCKKKEETHFDN